MIEKTRLKRVAAQQNKCCTLCTGRFAEHSASVLKHSFAYRLKQLLDTDLLLSTLDSRPVIFLFQHIFCLYGKSISHLMSTFHITPSTSRHFPGVWDSLHGKYVKEILRPLVGIAEDIIFPFRILQHFGKTIGWPIEISPDRGTKIRWNTSALELKSPESIWGGPSFSRHEHAGSRSPLNHFEKAKHVIFLSPVLQSRAPQHLFYALGTESRATSEWPWATKNFLMYFATLRRTAGTGCAPYYLTWTSLQSHKCRPTPFKEGKEGFRTLHQRKPWWIGFLRDLRSHVSRSTPTKIILNHRCDQKWTNLLKWAVPPL